MQKRVLAVVGVFSAIAAAAPASAEVIEITGEFAAPYRAPSMLGSLHVERFGGQDGQQLTLAMERALARAPFALVAGRVGRDTAEGSLSGAVTTGVEESGFKRKEKKCVERDANKKCIKEEETELRCTRRVINVNADLRIVDNNDGRILYSRALPMRDDVSWCQGQSAPRTVEDFVRNSLDTIAATVRGDITPNRTSYRIRLRESTKGMPKDVAKQFKALIKSSQRDMRSACATWMEMDKAMPGNASVTYNLGLCAEQAGDYRGAIGFYQQAVRAGERKGEEGIDRANRLIAGKADADERARRRRG